MTLDELNVEDLYGWMDELDDIMGGAGFNGRPFAYRTGVRRTRCYLDHVASGLRMMRGGEYEAHSVGAIHRHRGRREA